MPIKRPQLVNGEIYHIILRGVADQIIFKNIDDNYRGIFSLFEFNNLEAIEIRLQRRKRKHQKAVGELFSDTREKMVEILAFCFMPNHIHLLIRQLKNNGITQFMRKFGAGYAMYFNKKYQRKGHLFQGRFRAVHIGNEEQLRTVFVYIHTNPISLTEPKWKELGIKGPTKVLKFLKNYKWSSYPDYLGKKNFPSLTARETLSRIMGGKDGCRKSVARGVRYKKELKDWGKLALE